MIRTAIAFTITLLLLTSCSKTENPAANKLVGTWIFTNRISTSFAYPSVLTNPFPLASSSWSISMDSIKISFDNSGNFIFSNFNLPVDKGKYVVVKDSILIIDPDTAGLVKFNYSLISLTNSSTTGPVQYLPYQDFRFSSDTIIMKGLTSNHLSLSTNWLTKATNPIIPSNDTLILNASVNNFKRQ
jgi:hypothetical protein